MILEVGRLSVSFRQEREEVHALEDVSFSLRRGETLAIVGESGSGKSVTALSLLRLIDSPPGRISADRIRFLSASGTVENLLTVPEDRLREIRGKEIAMIFQEPMTALNPVYTCGNQVSEALTQHLGVSRKDAREKTIRLFDEVRLPRPEQLFSSFPHQLSGGQKQRVMIAMAMACNPAILIADEPTTALDVTVQKSILELMQELKIRHRMSMIFITHDLSLLPGFADQVLVMYRGKTVEYGPVHRVFASPQHPYTQGLLSCRPKTEGNPRRLPTVERYLAGEKAEEPSRSESETERRRKNMYELPPILVVRGLKTYFPSRYSFFGSPVSFVRAVNDVSFEVYPGETLGIVGESGCGKSTLGRSILNLIRRDSGELIFQGKPIPGMTATEKKRFRRDLQIIFQDPYSSLNPRIKAGKAITEPMRVHGIGSDDRERTQRAIALLEKVGLSYQHFHRYPHEFSGGQRQRICIARALALQPRLLICDESVSALDISVQAQVLNLLNDLKEEFGFTYLFISHDLSVVKFMSDRIMVMRNGKIVEIGVSERVFYQPETDYTRTLISAIPGYDRAIDR